MSGKISHRSTSLDFGSVRVRPPVAMAGQRIGLLGGSFNPAHEGHARLSQFALKKLGLSAVWWLVSPGNPIKSHAELAAHDQRLRTARVSAGADRRFVVTGFEKDLPTAYTAATLGFLRRRYPATRFVWLMGADSLVTFDRWWQWRCILETMPVAVIDRPGWRLRGLSSKAASRYGDRFVPEDCAMLLAGMDAPAWTFLTVPLSPQSSTALRAAGSKT
jgi:nicotinate-nucleotide adenylyltransferase